MTLSRKTRRLDELPQEAAPGRDLWLAIAAQIAPAQSRPKRRLGVAPWLAWAVTAGLAVVATGTWWMQRDPGVAALTAGDPALKQERERLAAELPAMLDALPFADRFGAQQSLRAVRSAQSQILAALRKDAADPELLEWLRDNQQQEVRVMRSIASAGALTRSL
jgi:hypothetical protein